MQKSTAPSGSIFTVLALLAWFAAPTVWAAPETPQAVTADPRSTHPDAVLPVPRFTIPADNTNCVVDNLTGLMWTRHASLSGPGPLSWEAAVAFCGNLEHGGYSDWRLPQIRELYSLMNPAFTRPTLSNAEGTAPWKEGDPFQGVRSYGVFYWAATTTQGPPTGAWLVSFFTGTISQDNESTGSGYVWPVRTVK